MTEIRVIWRTSGPGIKLILANLAVYVVYLLLRSIFVLTGYGNELNQFVSLFQLPGSFELFIRQPWSLFTHMFIHTGFWHLVINMLTLYFSITLFTRYFDERNIGVLYIASGLLGAFSFLISVNLFPLFSNYVAQIQALGASAAVMGVLMATCFYKPDDEVYLFGAIKLKLYIVALVFILIDLAQIGSGTNAAGHLAHLGGAMMGYIWAINMKKGKNILSFTRIFTRFRQQKKTAPLRKRRINPIEEDERYNLARKQKQQKLDEILDKISRSGYDSLSKEEKSILFDASKN